MRRRVLELLQGADGPLDAGAIAALVDVHVSTARFHLEQLQEAGLVRREVDRIGRRGRPAIRFSAVPAARDDVQEQLSHVLASVISEDPDGGRARAIRAGETWSEAFADDLSREANEGSAPIVRLLGQLEFEPELDDDGASIALKACPFRDEARRNPGVICSVHLGLLQRAARTLGHEEGDVGLRPFVGPELCIVDLVGDWSARQPD